MTEVLWQLNIFMYYYSSLNNYNLYKLNAVVIKYTYVFLLVIIYCNNTSKYYTYYIIRLQLNKLIH